MTERIVPGEGPIPAPWCIVGEGPGQEEAYRGRPFVGKTGQEQDRHLERGGLKRRDGYLTNLCKDYHEGNPSPTPADVERWGPELIKEMRRVRPKFIIAAGYHAVRFFLGESAHLEAVHGIPHRWSDSNGLSCAILPTYHPAAHFYAPDLLPHIVWDYARACAAIRGRLPVDPPVDRFPNAEYWDLDEGNADWYLGQIEDGGEIGIDTEGYPGNEWSLQVSVRPGTGLVMRKGHRHYDRVLRLLLKKLRKHKPLLVGHAWLYDGEMAPGLGLDVMSLIGDYGLKIFDTMMAAYLLCIEPQSLKTLARRHCGMEMHEYSEVVGQAGLEKQLAYLESVMEEAWPKPEPRIETDNGGKTKLYTPQPVGRRAEAILSDYYSEKLDKDGNRTDPLKRWRKVDRDLRRMVERKLGRMPLGTLADIPLDRAVRYSGRDPDATLRVYHRLRESLVAERLADLMDMKMRMLPVAVEMKINGILGKKSAFEALTEFLQEEMDVIRNRMSRLYFKSQPFNPASQPQTATLLRKLGLEGEKKTKTGKVSTSKKSIEHLRFTNPAIEDLEQWRERQKARDSFAEPILDNWPDEVNGDIPTVRVHCDLKITRVTSGRFSATLLDDEPSAPLLAIPVRSHLGKKVRDCYTAEEGYVLGSFDLDQAEMRVMADEAGDERMIKLFRDGKIDIHTDTASKMFGIKPQDVHKMKHRYPAKRVGFGVITGIQGPGLLDQLRLVGIMEYDVEDCDRFIREWLKVFPAVKTYMEWCRSECRRQGGVIRDRWGMPRYLPAILDETRDGKWERLEAERQTHSHRIQGGAQGLIQRAMGALWPKLRVYGDAVRFILQIHDELIFEAMEGLEEEIGPIVVNAMCNTTKLKVPIKSSGSWAKSWGQLKD